VRVSFPSIGQCPNPRAVARWVRIQSAKRSKMGQNSAGVDSVGSDLRGTLRNFGLERRIFTNSAA
jgi:hypothetical protein